MTGLYVMIAVCIALSIACIAMCVLLLKKAVKNPLMPKSRA